MGKHIYIKLACLNDKFPLIGGKPMTVLIGPRSIILGLVHCFKPVRHNYLTHVPKCIWLNQFNAERKILFSFTHRSRPLNILTSHRAQEIVMKRKLDPTEGSGDEEEGEESQHKKVFIDGEFCLKELPPVPNVKLEPISEEVRKRKVAILVAYCGSGYFGLQINLGFRTVEGDFIKALRNADLITEENANDIKLQTGFQRASRTDKGVSAAGNVFSLKIKHSDDAKERLNKCLPPQIRVLGVIKVTKGFDSKNSVNSRTYLYLLPTFSFAPHNQSLNEAALKGFRIYDEMLQEVNKLFGQYKGTRNYHNFTNGKLPTDPSAKRFITHMKAGTPFIVDGVEFCVISVRGQSFMIHQIRKMIALVIAVARGVCEPLCLTDKVWGPNRVDIPRAPGLGLMLDKLHYDTYNRKFGNDGLPQPLDWDEYKEEMEAFKLDQVFANIARTEIEAMAMKAWLETLPIHSYDVKSGRELIAESATVAAATAPDAGDTKTGV